VFLRLVGGDQRMRYESVGDLEGAFVCGVLYQDGKIRFEFGACHTGVRVNRFCVTADAVCHIIITGFGVVARLERVLRVLWVVTGVTLWICVESLVMPDRRDVLCRTNGMFYTAQIGIGGGLYHVRQIRKVILVSC
jgi:hypothetical protein